ncbi:MAG TPA: NAD-dependent succinate-semialdehyde dehydrogenase [Acidimicrobiales bacterium]
MTFTAINPATEAVLAEYPTHDDAFVDAAVGTAHEAFLSWKKTPFSERTELMNRVAELLESEIPVAAALMTSEMGKTFAAAKGEAAKCALTMRYYAERAEGMLAEEIIKTHATKSGIRYEPLGPLLAIMPWNFPLWQIIRVAVPNIMAGNPILLKHSSSVPGCAQYVEGLFTRAGFPQGIFTNLFVESRRIELVIADPRVAAVTVTGSEGAGRSVASLAGKHLKKCVLELGGSDPFIVAKSADLDHTVPLAVTARLQNNGQACICAKRFIVVRDVADEFISRFSAAMAAAPTGDPMDSSTILGPLANEAQFNTLSTQVSESIAQGAVAVTGGTPLDGTGYFFAPTVLVDVPETSPAGNEELFGPVAVVHVVDDLDEAIRYANDTPWGLSGSVWATDPAEIDQAITTLDVGIIFANAVVASMNELPFGGVKASGYGRELGVQGVREFTNVKSFFIA